MQLHAIGEQAFERRRIELVVLRQAPLVGVGGSLLKDGLVDFRKCIPLIEIDEGEQHRAAFPPAGIVVVRRDLVEAELFVVVGTDPFGGVDGALFQRRIDVAAGDLLRNRTELLQHAPGESADAEFQTLEIVNGIDLLAEPAAHLAAGIAREQSNLIVLLVKLVEHFLAATQREPALVQTRVRAKCHRSAEGEGRILAEIVVGGGVTALDCAILHGVNDLQGGHDFAACKNLDLELIISRRCDGLGHCFGSAEQRIERLRPTASHAPFDLGHRLRDGRRSNRGSGNTGARSFQKLTTLHFATLPDIFLIAGSPAPASTRYLTLRGMARTMTELAPLNPVCTGSTKVVRWGWSRPKSVGAGVVGRPRSDLSNSRSVLAPISFCRDGGS